MHSHFTIRASCVNSLYFICLEHLQVAVQTVVCACFHFNPYLVEQTGAEYNIETPQAKEVL